MDDAGIVASVERPGRSAPPNMIWIPGGTFRMGSDGHYPEEAPVHRVTVDGFWIDALQSPTGNFENSSTIPATSPLPRLRPIRTIIPARCRICLKPASLVFTPPTYAGRSA